MLRERKKQIGWDALECLLTRGPAVLYGFFLLRKPAEELVVYGGLAAAAAALILKMWLVAVRRPTIYVEAKDEAQALEMGKEGDRAALVYWGEGEGKNR